MPTFASMSQQIPPFLSLEIAQRMDEKLAIVRIDPKQIGHLGELDLSVLGQRYSRAKHCCIQADNTSHRFKNLLNRFLGRTTFNSVNKQQFQTSNFDLLWSNLQLQQHPDPKELVFEWKQCLSPESLLMFSYLGPDTGKELRKYFKSEDLSSPQGMWDMHDVGDSLLKAGFAEPVMDMEYITLVYDNWELLRNEAFHLGLLKTPTASCQAKIDQSPIEMTIEVVYGHAWTPRLQKSPSTSGLATIRPEEIIRPKK
jgi:malonyl-CoA O-methyltransferase